MKEREPVQLLGIPEEYPEPEEPSPRKKGPLIFQMAILLSLLVMAGQMWRLQIVEGARYQGLAEANRFRLNSVDAPRGIIYDRKGRVLVQNEATFVVRVLPAGLPPEREAEVLGELARILALAHPDGSADLPDLGQLLREGRRTPQKALVIQRGIPREMALILREKLPALPGVSVQAEPRRHYPYGPLLAHILGYVGSIPPEELEGYLDQEDAQYDQGDQVGRMGVERTYEKYLRGHKGRELVEVDANEEKLQVLGEEAPRPGKGLVLTIDLELQRAVESALLQGMKKARSSSAVAVALDPRNGDILALVSLPSYDNNLFSRELAPEELEALLADPHRPLVDHAIGGQYPPGSIIKPFLALAALEEKVLEPQERLRCEGTLLVPHRYFPDDPSKAQPFYCWLKAGHGSINLEEAIAQSCDIFFYQLGGGYKEFEGLGLERLTEWLRRFGLGEETGIALPGEVQGLVPSAKWKEVNYQEQWLLGDTYNLSIGQGFLLATPLQLASATSAIANGGTLFQPRLVREICDAEGGPTLNLPPQAKRQLKLSKEDLELVRQGMRAAVVRGTAKEASLPGVAVAGKTGTAEYPGPRDASGRLPTHAWFLAFAPAEAPEIALVVLVEGGGEGSQVAAPIAREILRSYFGLPAEKAKGTK